MAVGVLAFLVRALVGAGHDHVRSLARTHQPDLGPGLLLDKIGIAQPGDPLAQSSVGPFGLVKLAGGRADAVLLREELTRRLYGHGAYKSQHEDQRDHLAPYAEAREEPPAR